MKGFTLIEILVVLFIIGLTTGVIIITASRPDVEQQAHNLALEIENAIALKSQEGLIFQQTQGIIVTAKQLQWMIYDPIHQKWIVDRSAKKQILSLPAEYQFELSVDKNLMNLTLRNVLNPIPHIILYSTGGLTPFVLNILANKTSIARIEGLANGEMILNEQQ